MIVHSCPLPGIHQASSCVSQVALAQPGFGLFCDLRQKLFCAVRACHATGVGRGARGFGDWTTGNIFEPPRYVALWFAFGTLLLACSRWACVLSMFTDMCRSAHIYEGIKAWAGSFLVNPQLCVHAPRPCALCAYASTPVGLEPSAMQEHNGRPDIASIPSPCLRQHQEALTAGVS